MRTLGFKTFVGQLDCAAADVLARARSGDGGYAVLANLRVLVGARHDDALAAALRGAWAVFPDGAPVAWLQRRQGELTAAPISGADLMCAVAQAGAPAELRHALVGGTEDTLGRLERRLRSDVPDIRICAAIARPRVGLTGLDACVDAIRLAGADIVWVSLLGTRQELFLARHADCFGGLTLGVGSAFDLLARSSPRARRGLRAHGFQWVQRLATEPRVESPARPEG
jgi:N-acetylglucosaminyldiphosphoundecaprenol N-acetyl-beta-D-mannosaminyltransferase